MATKQKEKPKPQPKKEKKPAPVTKVDVPDPVAPAPEKVDIRVSPVTQHPRARIIRITVSEHWGAAYISGRGRTYRIYPEREKDTARGIEEIHRDLQARVLAAQKELGNENPNS